jgi:hypothetical protein
MSARAQFYIQTLLKVEAQQHGCTLQKVCVIIAANTDGWGHAALRRQQLYGGDIGLILKEIEGQDYPKWKDIRDCSPLCNSYWPQWNSLMVRDDMLEHQWESADGWCKKVTVILP